MNSTANVRMLAVNTVTDVMENGKYSHIEIRNALKKYSGMSRQDRAFFKRLSEGTVERAIELDYIINLFSKTDTVKMRPFIRNLLRISVYQIKYMDSVPDRAACSEALKLAETRGFGPLKGFVNGVLKNIAARKDDIQYPDRKENAAGYLEVKYSMPRMLVDKFINDFGADCAEKMFKAYLADENITTVRVNLSRASVRETVRLLEDDGTHVSINPYYENALDISDYGSPENLRAFKSGAIFIQNISSMLAVDAADPKEGDFILDVCAAPGGKSIHAADIMNGTGYVTARDISEKKAALIQENISRCGFKNIHTQVHDALVYDGSLKEKADIVIADLPCSGLGVIGNKSDIKYRISADGMRSLAKLQRDILSVVSGYVKPGGYLLYSTCTVNPEENEGNALWFAENFPFEAVDISAVILAELTRMSDGAGRGKFVQILPEANVDGFFIAKFRRV